MGFGCYGSWVLFPGVGLVVLVDDDSFERVCGRWLSCAFLWVWVALVAAWHLGCLWVLGWVFACEFGVFRVCLGGWDSGGGGLTIALLLPLAAALRCLGVCVICLLVPFRVGLV